MVNVGPPSLCDGLLQSQATAASAQQQVAPGIELTDERVFERAFVHLLTGAIIIVLHRLPGSTFLTESVT